MMNYLQLTSSIAQIDQAKAAEQISNFPWMKWLLIALIIIVGLLIIYIIVRLILRFLKQRVAIKKMREELRLRRDLADMASGKDAKAQRKEEFHRIETIKLDVDKAFATMHVNNIKPSHTPTWFILGEPGSGKSRLMESGGLEYPSGLNDLSRGCEATSTLNLWLSNNGSIWDVGGRLFLSRWGKQRDEEWKTFLTHFKKHNNDALINGVILTIPADCLLYDDSDLRKKKMSLIAEELRVLSQTLGLYCPVWVTITKSDLIPGFSEFFACIPEQQCDEILGWQNKHADGRFDEDVFNSEFIRMEAKLLELRDSLLMNEGIWKRSANGENRADIVGPLYSYPEQMLIVKDKLCDFIKGIFLHVKQRKQGAELRYRGCWFTAALDRPQVSTERLVLYDGVKKEQSSTLQGASGQETPIDTAGIVTIRERIVSQFSHRHYFAKKLLQDVVTKADNYGDYTPAAVARIRKPFYFWFALLLLIAIPTMVLSALHYSNLCDDAQLETSFWQKLALNVENDELGRQSLLGYKDGKVQSYLYEPFAHKNYSRQRQLSRIRNVCFDGTQTNYVWTLGNFFFDRELKPSLLKTSQEFAYSSSVVAMVTVPVIRSFCKYVIANENEGTHALWNQRNTDSMIAIMHMNQCAIRRENGIECMDETDYTQFNLLEGSSGEILNNYLRNAYDKDDISLRRDELLFWFLEPFSYNNALTLHILTKNYAKSVVDASIYPELNYASTVEFIESFQKFQDLIKECSKAEQELFTSIESNNPQALKIATDKWLALYPQAKKMATEIATLENELHFTTMGDMRLAVNNKRQEMHAALQHDTERYAKAIINLGESSNASYLKSIVTKLDEAMAEFTEKDNALSAKITDEMCHFWAFSADDSSNKRRWRNAIEHLDGVRDLISFDIRPGDDTESFHIRIVRINNAKKLYDAKVSAITNNKEDKVSAIFWEKNWMRLLEPILQAWLDKAPQSMESFAKSFPKPAEPTKLPPLLFTKASDSEIPVCFDPVDVDEKVSDYTELLTFLQETIKPDANSEQRRLKSEADELSGILRDFVQSYIVYWGQSVPAGYRITGIQNWKEYVRSAQVVASQDMRPYIDAVNDSIIRALSISIFKDNAYPLADEKKAIVVAAKEAMNNSIAQRIVMTAGFIRMLPDDASEAWQTICSMKADNFFDLYWGGWYRAGETGSLVWWDNYLLLGMGLLREEVSSSLKDQLQDCLPLATAFPLCNQSNRESHSILSMYNIQDLYDRLTTQSCTFSQEDQESIVKKGDPLGIPVELLNMALPLGDKRGDAWGKILDSIKQIANPEMPLSAQIYLPPAAQRAPTMDTQKAATRTIAVERRYPYCRIARGGSAISPVFLFSQNNEQNLDLISRELAADASDLEFQFFRFADSKSPDARYKVSGAWSVLNLYLSDDTILDKDGQSAIVPISFVDASGYTCQFMIGIKFNQPMVPPTAWPRADVFAQGKFPRNDEIDKFNKELRKMVQAAFISRGSKKVLPSKEDRAALIKEIKELAGINFGIKMEVVLPNADECPDEARILACMVFRYMALGNDMFGSSKLASLPDQTSIVNNLQNALEPLHLRLYRFADDEYPTAMVNESDSLLNYAIENATSYDPIRDYLIVPVTVQYAGRSFTYSLFLSIQIGDKFDDGLNALFPD